MPRCRAGARSRTQSGTLLFKCVGAVVSHLGDFDASKGPEEGTLRVGVHCSFPPEPTAEPDLEQLQEVILGIYQLPPSPSTQDGSFPHMEVEGRTQEPGAFLSSCTLNIRFK